MISFSNKNWLGIVNLVCAQHQQASCRKTNHLPDARIRVAHMVITLRCSQPDLDPRWPSPFYLLKTVFSGMNIAPA
jgi:hypothetical protein